MGTHARLCSASCSCSQSPRYSHYLISRFPQVRLRVAARNKWLNYEGVRLLSCRCVLPLCKQCALLILYPAIVLTFFTLVATVPTMRARSARTDTVFNIFAWSAFAASAMAYLFMIGICGVAKAKFEKRGFGASYGNLVRELSTKYVPSARRAC